MLQGENFAENRQKSRTCAPKIHVKGFYMHLNKLCTKISKTQKYNDVVLKGQ